MAKDAKSKGVKIDVVEELTKHPGGRPTEYDPKFCDELLEHFNVEPNYLATRTITRKDGTVIDEKIEYPNNLPTFASFARKIGVHRETLLNWCETHPEFFDAYKKAKEFQDDILATNALKSLYNPVFSIFFAKNALDERYKDRVHTDVTSKGERIGSADAAIAAMEANRQKS